ncbi:hypothetical protein FKE98_11955 [Corynebacterium aurimucosum]|uniref:hypothetical protein n=1 Tax=Corynebacterium guaraldiae TaxID=3051103 RepID=UPI0012B8FBA6|nr:hypothetical protein [Corynebacterium guaraldiae]MDK6808439.1 hypothetical protein [Corynebacterium aurimucosum]MTE11061.1 hypothetical protein [Corynebacterium guaraldiae]NJJ82829.1 hypothetical protein [Corynebacterium aurimucosum]
MEKKLYLVSLSLIVFFAAIGAIFGLLNHFRWAFLFGGTAISLLPICSHLRMRRMLGAMRRLNGGSDHLADDHLRSLENTISKLTQKVETVSASLSNSEVNQLARLANEIRRESRMIRIRTEELKR